MMILADAYDHMPWDFAKSAFYFVAGALTLWVLVCLSVIYGRQWLGRKPAVDDDLKELRKQLAGLAPAEQVDLLITRLNDAATKEEVNVIRESMKGFVDQAQLDRRLGEMKDLLARVERDLVQQIKDLRGYVHDDVHAFRDQAQGVWANAEAQREGMHSRMNVFAETLFEIRGWIRAQREESAS